MARLAVAGGNATELLDLGGGDWLGFHRHGTGGYVLPHEIDHESNLRAALEAGCDRVLGIGSVGGLQPQLGPGTFVCPDDFISLATGGTILSGREAHRVHGFDRPWRERLLEAWSTGCDVPLVDGGVYWQTIGPRLETQAEIRAIARDADVIGMTLASECVVAGELGLAYAAVCVVDNYANGVGETELTVEELKAGRAANRESLARALEAVLPALA
jgi:5'-methylthioadenosine phosphorylase